MKLNQARNIARVGVLALTTAGILVSGGALATAAETTPQRIDSIKVETCPLALVNGRVEHRCPPPVRASQPARFVLPFCPQAIVNGRAQHVCTQRPARRLGIRLPYCPQAIVNGRAQHVCVPGRTW